MFNINIPEDVNLILDKLNENQYEAYIVGGCVRDSILFLEPKDWDITTSATPDQIIEVFNEYNIILTGVKHGTVTVVINDNNYEITTYRIDGKYIDGRHPEEVIFTSNLKEDLSRRDYTINSLAYSNKEGLVDYFDGIKDLNNKILRTVGEPKDRFNEDALRILRGIRFAAKLNLTIDPNTILGMEECSDNLKNISKERVRDEFNKILLANPMYIKTMNKLNVSHYICNEFRMMEYFNQNNPYHNLYLLNHCIYATSIVETLELKLTMIFHDIGKLYSKTVDEKDISHYKGHAKISANLTKDILKELKYSNETIHNVTTLIEIHDYCFSDNPKTIKKQLKKLLNKYGETIVRNLLIIRLADIVAQNPIYLLKRLRKLYLVENELEDILANAECFTIKDLDITGHDLINLNFNGKEIGEKLRLILSLVIEEKLINKKEIIIDYLKNKAHE